MTSNGGIQMHSKALSGVEIKSESQGEVEALFSTFGVKDHDGDVTDPGAFENGAKCLISAYNHQSWQGAMPVGKGVIEVGAGGARLKGQFFMDTSHGRDAFQTVKAIGDLQEWSYGFDVLSAGETEVDGAKCRLLKSLKVYEVSPVMRGAGIGTRTVGAKMRFAEHAQAVMADLGKLRARAAEVMAMRAEKGKGLSEESAELLTQIQAELKQFEELLAEPKPEVDTAATEELRRAYLRFVASEL